MKCYDLSVILQVCCVQELSIHNTGIAVVHIIYSWGTMPSESPSEVSFDILASPLQKFRVRRCVQNSNFAHTIECSL